jgi:hypothetical protein
MYDFFILVFFGFENSFFTMIGMLTFYLQAYAILQNGDFFYLRQNF